MRNKKQVNVFVSDRIHNAGIELLDSKFNVYKKYELSNDELLAFISSVCNKSSLIDVLVIRSNRKLDANFIKALRSSTNIRLICTVSSGFENVNTEACRKYKIHYLNVPDGNFISAAKHTFALILSIAKRLLIKHQEMQSGKFNSVSGENMELYDKTIGIIGVGRVGSYVARLAKGLRMKILGNDIKKSLKNKYTWIKFVSLNYLLKNSDIITVHTPLDNSTRNLINHNNIKDIGKNSIIINCARGGIINENALYISLKNNKIFYAGIDVFENEPDINFSFGKLNNVLLTPHIAGKTKESYKRMAIQAAKQLINFYK